jgi:hypothetical protein
MNDEIRVQNELTFDTFTNSVGNKIVLARLRGDVLMTAKQIAKLYGVSRVYITVKLGKLFRNKTLNKKRVSNILAHRADDGKLYETRYYNASAILAVGLAIKSAEVAEFQKRLGMSANKTLPTKH